MMFKVVTWHVMCALVVSFCAYVLACESASIGAIIGATGYAVIVGLSCAVSLRSVRTRKAWERRRELATRYGHMKVAC